ncbi:MAG: ATP-dependent DNA ligase [Myxococcales bacterium]
MRKLQPPIEPMLARLSRELPEGRFVYEPKWDGFRCLAFCGPEHPVDLRSRHGKPFARYFPEIVQALETLSPRSPVFDGELVVVDRGALDFPALMGRLHPARSRVQELAARAPAALVCFDLLAIDDVELHELPFRERRRRLEALLADAKPPLHLTPTTTDPAVAREWIRRFQGGGIDGVVAKEESLPYQPGRRGWIKVKHERTADCVVAGIRVGERDGIPFVASLLLGLYAGPDLVHVGVSSSFPAAQRRELFTEFRMLAVRLAGHPWERGFNLGRSPLGRLKGSAGRWDPDEMEQDWLPVKPVRVCEVGYDQVDGGRFRHPARFVRWRPDREPDSCRFDQLEGAPLRLEGLIRP